MDHSWQDIPMRLDINHQPLNFDIYLDQVIDIPKTSVEEPPYDFQLECEALEKVNQIIKRTLNETTRADNVIATQPSNLQMYMEQSPLQPTTIATTTQQQEQCNSQNTPPNSTQTAIAPPSCPTAEVPLTPIKCTIQPDLSAFNKNGTASITGSSNSTEHQSNQINLRDFEEMHYNPFDHLELQTIDELKELDLVFQASYANQERKQ